MRQAVETTKGSKLMLQGLALAYSSAGRMSEALPILKQLQERTDAQYLSPFFAACTSLSMNEPDQAMEYLEQAYRERDGALIYIAVFPRLDSLRGNARFEELIRRMKLGS